IGEQQGDARVALQDIQGIGRARGGFDPVAEAFQRLYRDFPQIVVVVHHEDVLAAGSGGCLSTVGALNSPGFGWPAGSRKIQADRGARIRSAVQRDVAAALADEAEDAAESQAGGLAGLASGEERLEG